MTLKEKFAGVLHQTKPHFVNIDSEECEQIADDFAIGFLNWYAMYGSRIEENLTSTELLKIYKEETGL